MKTKQQHEQEGGDWDGISCTNMGEAPKLAGETMVQTGNTCPNGCRTINGKKAFLIRFEDQPMGDEMCKGCNTLWRFR